MLKSYLTHKGNFFRQVVVLSGGTALSQALLILTAPLLTRLYTPETFGFFAIFTAVLSLILVMAAGRYEMAIPLASDEITAANLLGLSLSLGVLTASIFGLSLSYLNTLLPIPHANYIGLWVLGIVGAGSYQALRYWCTQQQRFALISMTQVQQAVTQVVVQISFGLVQAGSFGLIVGYLVAQWLGAGILVKSSRHVLALLDFAKWGAIAQQYCHFPLYFSWASLLNVMGWQIPALLFARYFSIEVAGSYALTLRVLGMPSVLLGQAIMQVFYPRVAQAEPQVVKALIERLIKVLFVLGFPGFALIWLQGPTLFQLIFGEDWRQAGYYARWLSPWFMLAFIASPLSTFALVKSKQRQALWLTGYETSLRLIAISIGILFDSVTIALQLLSAAGVLICLVYIIWILQLAGSSIRKIVVHLNAIILIGLLIVVSLLLLKSILLPAWSLGLSILTLSIFMYQALQRIINLPD